MRDVTPLPLRSVRRLRLLAVGLALLGLLVSATGIGHAHVGTSVSTDACAVCVHARGVAVAPEAATVLDPVVLATPAPTGMFRIAPSGRVTRTRSRGPPRSTSSFR